MRRVIVTETRTWVEQVPDILDLDEWAETVVEMGEPDFVDVQVEEL